MDSASHIIVLALLYRPLSVLFLLCCPIVFVSSNVFEHMPNFFFVVTIICISKYLTQNLKTNSSILMPYEWKFGLESSKGRFSKVNVYQSNT